MQRRRISGGGFRSVATLRQAQSNRNERRRGRSDDRRGRDPIRPRARWLALLSLPVGPAPDSTVTGREAASRHIGDDPRTERNDRAPWQACATAAGPCAARHPSPRPARLQASRSPGRGGDRRHQARGGRRAVPAAPMIAACTTASGPASAHQRLGCAKPTRRRPRRRARIHRTRRPPSPRGHDHPIPMCGLAVLARRRLRPALASPGRVGVNEGGGMTPRRGDRCAIVFACDFP